MIALYMLLHFWVPFLLIASVILLVLFALWHLPVKLDTTRPLTYREAQRRHLSTKFPPASRR